MKRGRSSLSVMVKQGGSVHRVSGSYRPEDRSWSGAHALTGCGTRSGNASRTRFAINETGDIEANLPSRIDSCSQVLAKFSKFLLLLVPVSKLDPSK